MNTLYDWSKAPEWAKFAATDADGTEYWYESKPKKAGYVWLVDGRFERVSPATKAWTETLEARP